MGNRTFRDGKNLSIVREPESVEDEVVNHLLTRDFDGETVSEEDLEELLNGD